MDELPQLDGTSRFKISDSGFVDKLMELAEGEEVTIGEPYYDEEGHFYHVGYLRD